MTNEEAIKYLWQIYPNGAGTWLDEQRTIAIGMAIDALGQSVTKTSDQGEQIHRTQAEIESAMAEVEEKSKAFTAAHQGESAEEILAQMRGEEPAKNCEICPESSACALGDRKNCVLEEELVSKFNSCVQEGDKIAVNEDGTRFNVSQLERVAKKESASDEFEQEWKEYFKCRGDVATVNIKDLARHFVNWQREQDKQWLAEEHKHIFAKGRESMKEQMMKEAIEADVLEVSDDDYSICGHSHLELSVDEEYLYDRNLKDGDKVKLIIVKEK